ncbi:Retrovirus-related Pol polyprotein from transposon 17.6 [Choanephora cucurbitarum]|uniref:Retrovirus-related Pol polyprotein from transposon 17.6 n=1 Tax=Choanephora cucurbitarum TaxID=101091 RepID=A0A1C7MVQ4_9FUNG|nr:Retrovirus-related Pol polyprotein from transposon 17.6 [Choanephora cucurbitarum]
MTQKPLLKKGKTTKPKAVWTLTLELPQEAIAETEMNSLEATQQVFPGSDVMIHEGVDANGQKQQYTSVVIQAQAGKKDPFRLCLNYRPINIVIKDSGYLIPNINFLFTILGQATYFSAFDCLKGFWQLRLDEKSKGLTGFATTFGQFRWTRLPMGLKSSPAAWQKVMDTIFFEELYRFVLIYIDDALIFSTSFDNHLVHLETILKKAAQAGLSLSVTKCKFGYKEIPVLGHILSTDGFKMDQKKIRKVQEYPTPVNLTALNRFIAH